MGNVSVDVVDVSKKFRLYHEKYQSLKERTLHAGRTKYEDFMALDHVNFEVYEGETVGILGKNGCGKSTLLKCVSGILQPTSGKVMVRGKVAALLELGAGFQAELSGRENVFMNASLLGLSTKEVEKRFDEIVAFAELEQFIDNQVKYYSSGMYVRLGFAVAVNVDPDILVIDEVLAVGDEKFQRKCLERIKQFQEEGRTILFVTHSPDLVRAICDRVVVMQAGKVIGMGTPGEAIRIFREQLLDSGTGIEISTTNAKETEEATGLPPASYRPIILTKVTLEHPGQGSRTHMLPGEPLAVDIGFEALEPVEDVVFEITMNDSNGSLLYGTNTEILDYQFDAPIGEGTCRLSFDKIPLLDGTYYLSVGIKKRSGVVYDWREQEAFFEVMNPGKETGALALEAHADIFGPGMI